MRAFRLVIVILIVSCFVYVADKNNINYAKLSTDKIQNLNATAVQGDIYEYFPITPGKRFVYRVSILIPNAPLMHSVTTWPKGNGEEEKFESRDRLLGEDKEFMLILKVKGAVKKRGLLEYPEVYKIEIERDDLGVYEYNVGLFWAIPKSDRYQIIEIGLHDPDSPGAPTFAIFPGISARICFFAEKPETIIPSTDGNDSLAFFGPTMLANIPCLHFVRMVEPDKDKSPGMAYLEQGFLEKLWFGQGIGLVRLEQWVAGKIAMVWTLEDEEKFF